MQQGPGASDWLKLGSLCLAWGFSFLLVAIGLKSLPPLTLVTLRLVVGALVLYLIMRWQGHRLPTQGRWWLRFALLTTLGNLVPFTLISWGQLHIASGQAGLLMALVPISTMLLAHFFVEHEQLTPQRILGVLTGFAGVAALVGGETLAGLGGAGLVAQLAVIAATFSYAVNNVYTKRLPSLHGLVKATGSLVTGAALMLPFSLVLEQPWQLQVAPGPLLATFALGAISTGLGSWVFFVVVSRRGPNFVSLINYIIPALAFVAGAVLLGESVSGWQVLGLVVICSGIAISQLGRARPGITGQSMDDAGR
jgi:drug/metabolite transporter (DMT)-like permease